jgi:hypothetical protein
MMEEKGQEDEFNSSQMKAFAKALTGFLEELLKKHNDQMLTEHLIAAMTSGLKQTGATYNLPESLAIEYGRLCYNQAIKDVFKLCRKYDFGETGLEICDRIQDLVIYQEGKRVSL